MANLSAIEFQGLQEVYLMSLSIQDLIEDPRLERLVTPRGVQCAIQIWLLQIKKSTGVESHLLYGRALPYDFSNDRWSATRDDQFSDCDGVSFQVLRINLYCKPQNLARVITAFSGGDTLLEVNDKCGLSFSHSDDEHRFGSFKLDDHLAYRPVSFYPARGDYENQGGKGTHESSGEFSAAITNLNKRRLLDFGDNKSDGFSKAFLSKLNAETGFDFIGSDASRLGDFELLVFPTLDNKGRNLFHVEWINKGESLSISLEQWHENTFTSFNFVISLINDNSVIYSSLVDQSCDEVGRVKFDYSIPKHLSKIVDGTKIDVYVKDESGECFLYTKYAVTYIREVHLTSNIVTSKIRINSSWLSKHATPSDKRKIDEVEDCSKTADDRTTEVIKRQGDPWVSVNREIRSHSDQIQKVTSEGRFFNQHEQGKGSGRIDFAIWFKDLIKRSPGFKFFIFDPYFEDVGASLLAAHVPDISEIIVLTTRERYSDTATEEDDSSGGESEANGGVGNGTPVYQERINNLLACCERLSPLLLRKKLMVYALPPITGRKPAFHDRYILMLDGAGQPVKGFNLSNSIQLATENYPLLVTSIPADVLPDVVKYAEKVLADSSSQPTDNLNFVNGVPHLIYDSTLQEASTVGKLRVEPLAVLDSPYAGIVLSSWLCEPSLKGCISSGLKEKLDALGYIQGESLRGDRYLALGDLGSLLSVCSDDEFNLYWHAAGSLFAHSLMGDSQKLYEGMSSPILLQRLTNFLLSQDGDVREGRDDLMGRLDLSQDLEYWLIHLRGPEDYFERFSSKLGWASYFAIKILWGCDPARAIQLLEGMITRSIDNPEDVYNDSLCRQLISEISLNIEFGIEDEKILLLMGQSSDFMMWMGFCALERSISSEHSKITLLSDGGFTASKKVQFLGWAVNRCSPYKDKTSDVFQVYVDELFRILPTCLTKSDLSSLIDALRGRMRMLGWCEPWMFESIIRPLIAGNRVDVDDICDLWISELMSVMNTFLEGGARLFTLDREGQLTNISAYYLSISSLPAFNRNVKKLSRIVKQVIGPIKAPLSSTVDWGRWDASLKVAFWVYGFTQWLEYFLNRPALPNDKYEKLKVDSFELAMYRHEDEWKAMDHDGGEFAVFLRDRAELSS